MFSWDIRELGYEKHPAITHLSPGARALLLLMMQSADPATGGSIKRSNEAMGDWLGVKPREIRNRLRELKDAGLLVVDRPASQHSPPVRRLVNPYRQGGTPVPPYRQGGTPVPPGGHTRASQGGTPVPPGGHTRASKVNREVDLEVNPEDQDVVVDRGGWPASPAMDATPRGPNAPPTRKQLAAIASFADQLGRPAPEARTRGEASRLLDALRADAERQRAASRERARREGKRDAYEQQRRADEQARVAGLIGGE